MLRSLGRYNFKRATQPLSTQERIIKNRYLQQESQIRSILDNDHNVLSTLQVHAHNEHIDTLADSAFLQHWALFEWSGSRPDYLNTARSLSLLNSREEQDQFLDVLSQEPTYILVDGEQSPDRGSRRFLTRVSASYTSLSLVIYGDEQATFLEDWQRLARETHLPSTQLLRKD